jgi:adenylate cyclase
MISSKALIDQTGISRATLNNYIQLGILPKPVVQSFAADAGEGGARILGFFPEDAIERVQAVQALKGQGLSMVQIAESLSSTDVLLEDSASQENKVIKTPAPLQSHKFSHEGTRPKSNQGDEKINISLENLAHPAYMLNYNFELTWLNEVARKELFGFDAPPARSSERNLLQLISRPESRLSLGEQRALTTLHLQLASSRVAYDALHRMIELADSDLLPLLENVVFQDKAHDNTIFETEFFRKDAAGDVCGYRVYAVYFREGILVVHEPSRDRVDDLFNFLGKRDQVIRSLLSKRLPVLTPLAVIVADLQNSMRICSELPPDEYFALINQIWATMSPILRKYTGTHGKHVGDGVVYYFFPQPESNYLFNAVLCAGELRVAMRKISAEWQVRKSWFTELQLNIGIHEGQEWLGAFQSTNHVEFAVLGNTINQASRLSDFARHGSIWATKNLISRLTSEERSRIEFGVLRKSVENGDRFIPSTYAQVESLIDLGLDKHEKLRGIGQLAVAEIRQVSATRLY